MKVPANAIRWWILATVTAAVLLLRIFREEWLQGKNPLLFLVLALGLYIGYRLLKK